MRMPVHKNSPIFPAAKVFIPFTTGGGVQADLNSFALSNNYKTVMDVTEVRFLVVPNPVAAPVWHNPNIAHTPLWRQFDFGGILSARLATSKVALTPDFVHLRSFAEPRQWNLNASLDLNAAVLPYNSTAFTWKFRRPMSVRPGDGIRGTIQLDPAALWPVDPTVNNPQFDDPEASVFTGCDVWVGLVGKLRAEPLPDLLPYPMALEWNPVIQPAGPQVSTYPAYAATGQTQLRNVGRSDMRVERLVASLYAQFVATAANAPDSTYAYPLDILNFLPMCCDTSLMDSKGYAVVGERSPLASVVDPRSGNWRFESVLAMEEQFAGKVFANPVPAGLFPQGSNADKQPVLFPHLALIGEQLVAVPR